MSPGGPVQQPYSASVQAPIDCSKIHIPICRTGPPGYIGWRNRFLRIDSRALKRLQIPALFYFREVTQLRDDGMSEVEFMNVQFR